MLSIEAHNLHWLEGASQEQDLCAHGGFVLRHDGVIVVDQRSSQWTLSAAALYLLRSLEASHTRDTPLGDHLFPCCGHAMFSVEGSDDVVIVGCPNGYNIEVHHSGDEVVLYPDGVQKLVVSQIEWQRAVVRFADDVEAFYAVSAEKEPVKEDAEGFAVFLAEWKRRRQNASAVDST